MTRNEIMQAILDGTPIYYNDKPVEVGEIYATSIWVKDVGQVNNKDLSVNKPIERRIVQLEGSTGLIYSLLIEGDSFKIIYATKTLDNVDSGTDAQHVYDSLDQYGEENLLRLFINGMVETIKELSK